VSLDREGDLHLAEVQKRLPFEREKEGVNGVRNDRRGKNEI
jgi:hypothetical protein